MSALILRLTDKQCRSMGISTAEEARERLFGKRRAQRPTPEDWRAVRDLSARLSRLEHKVGNITRTSPDALRRDAIQAGIEAARYHVAAMRLRGDRR